MRALVFYPRNPQGRCFQHVWDEEQQQHIELKAVGKFSGWQQVTAHPGRWPAPTVGALGLQPPHYLHPPQSRWRH